jgi:hypothetical protein
MDASSPQALANFFPEVTYRRVIFASVLVFLASAILHWPSFHIYSDIINAFWSRTNSAGVPFLTYEIPYTQYIFEYPPICGLVIWVGGWLSGGSLTNYALIEFTILGIFFVSTTHVLYKFLERLKLNHNLQLLFSLLVPSAVAFAAYNFDVIETFFIVLSLYLYVCLGRAKLSSISLGLAVATKLYPILLVPLFIQDVKSVKSKVSFALLSLGTVVALNLPFALVNYSTWLGGYLYLKNWGLEDTFLVWLFPSRSSIPVAEAISALLIAGSCAAVYLLARNQNIILRSFLVTGAFVLFSYIAPPQLNLDLLPFFALVPLIPIPLFYLFESTNLAFIALWDSFPNPSLPGVVQAIALARQILLATILFLLWTSGRTKAIVRAGTVRYALRKIRRLARQADLSRP